MKAERTSAIGIMSGTSLDGLDLCHVVFELKERWTFEIVASECIGYDDHWRSQLRGAHLLAANELDALSDAFGIYTGEQVNAFLAKTGLERPELVCSHGHTVFHEPAKRYTLQIGNGELIARTTGITTVSDFRSLDVKLGGQGAPLVPIGDELLFPEYAACLNLGGFSNISYKEEAERRAFDVCPVNIVLNPLANALGLEYDKGGAVARTGAVNEALLQRLNALAIYEGTKRPSLAREWLETTFMPLVDASSIPTESKLRTLVEHAAMQIARVINQKAPGGKVLATGGGVKNDLLMERMRALSTAEIVIPKEQTVDFKEALIFAFLGVLRMRNRINVLRSVTGAERDSSSGVVHSPS